MVQQTSLLAYGLIADLGARQHQVYLVIELGAISNLEIASKLDWPINSVTPRTKELVDKGLVKESHKDKSPITGRTVMFWTVT